MTARRADDEIERIAADLVGHRTARRTRAPISDDAPLALDDAYRIQALVTAAREARGERVVGWKLGYTSLAMRVQMGVDAPNFGPLTDAMLVADGGRASSVLMQPRVEPEIALRFRHDLVEPRSVDDVLAAVDHAFACLEVVDSVFTGYRFRLEDNTADGSSAAQVVIGPPLPSTAALDAVDVEFRRNGEVLATASGAAASGHPALGVVWLVGQLAARGRYIRAGEFVITGGLTSAAPLEPGDVIEALFDAATRVSVSR